MTIKIKVTEKTRITIFVVWSIFVIIALTIAVIGGYNRNNIVFYSGIGYLMLQPIVGFIYGKFTEEI